MFVIYGSKKEREQFLKRNAIPYFSVREDTEGTTYLYSEHDEPFEMHIDLKNGTYQTGNLLGTCIEEIDFPTYREALEEYESIERRFNGLE